MKRLALIGLLTLPGCVTNQPVGNELGGTIAWSRANEGVYFQQATDHCAKFRKLAKVRSVNDWHGGAILFDCI